MDNGLTVVGDHYKAESGFSYASGYRQFGDLNIIEDIATGTAVSFLIGIKVFDKEGNLIIDKRMKKGCYYEREVARKTVHAELLNMLKNHKEGSLDYVNASSIIDQHLKQAYYSKSYAAINSWAIELGIY